MSYDATSESFTVDLVRTGQWPFYVSGVTAGGSPEDILIEGGNVYYGDPGPFTANFSADSVQYVDGERQFVRMKGATLRVGSIPVLPLPSYTHYLGNAPYFLDIGGGYDSQLGAHLQTTSLFPVFDASVSALTRPLLKARRTHRPCGSIRL